MSDPITLALGLTALAYLWGSLPIAVIVCRILGIPDPRKQGSGNPGTTNVLRIGNRQAASLTLAGDAGKGFLAVLPCILLDLSPLSHSLCAVAAVLGHMFSLFTSFRGGKGVATAFGISAGLFWPVALFQIIIWCLTAAINRISSLASITTALLSPLFIWLLAPDYLITFWTLAALLIYSHKRNIANLLKGNEPRL